MSLSNSIDLRRSAGLRIALRVNALNIETEQNTHHKRRPRKCYVFQLVQTADLTNGPVTIGNPWSSS
jgi:hypothetical protein